MKATRPSSVEVSRYGDLEVVVAARGEARVTVANSASLLADAHGR